MKSTEKKIMLVDDHNLFRCGLKIMIESEKIGRITAEASNGKEFLDQLNSSNPDLIIMDIDMPVMDGITATEEALKINPDLNILVLSMHGDQNHFNKLINVGAKGFVLKSSGKSELEEAIERVSRGENYFSRDLLQNILSELNLDILNAPERDRMISLDDEEKKILELICKGFSSTEIAKKLELEINAFESIRLRLLNKTHSDNTAELIVYAIKNRIVTLF